MGMAFFQKTAGLKLHVGRKGEYTYLIVAISLSLVLLGAAGYSIWYSSGLLQRLSDRQDTSGMQVTHFSLSQVQSDPLLLSAQSWLKNLAPATSTATTTPSGFPQMKH